ncbi:MAG: hypothetical protein GF329_06545 [Candidatus Lokiarchaeota archaeon]|nr:hypothetical protein [Candidatus Lokiarchaeota archaeon]
MKKKFFRRNVSQKKRRKKRNYPILDIYKSNTLGSYYIIISRLISKRDIKCMHILIDAWKMGLKDCIIYDFKSKITYRRFISKFIKADFNLERIKLAEAYWHIQHDLRIAKSVGTEIPKVFLNNKYLIGNYESLNYHALKGDGFVIHRKLLS